MNAHAKQPFNAPRLIPSGPAKITTWGQALRQCRERAGFTLREIAGHASTGAGEVDKWEAGLGFPSSYQLKGIYTLKGMRVLTTFQHLLPERSRDPEPAATPPAPAVATPPAPAAVIDAGSLVVIPPSRPNIRNFRDALRYLREEVEKIGQRELGALGGVHGSTISGWEMGLMLPMQANYDKLLELIPALRDYPKPRGLKDGSPRGKAPASAPRSPAEEAGAAYARALVAAEQARGEHKAAIESVRIAEAAVKAAEAAVTEAENNLLAVARA